MSLKIFPNEMIEHISTFLDDKSLIHFSYVCKEIYNINNDLRKKRYNIKVASWYKEGIESLLNKKNLKGIEYLLKKDPYILNVSLLDSIMTINDEDTKALIRKLYSINRYRLGCEKDKKNMKTSWYTPYTLKEFYHDINHLLINRVFNYRKSDMGFSNCKFDMCFAGKSERNKCPPVYIEEGNYTTLENNIGGSTLLFSFDKHEHTIDLIRCDSVTIEQGTSLYGIHLLAGKFYLKGDNIIKNCSIFYNPMKRSQGDYTLNCEGSNIFMTGNSIYGGPYEHGGKIETYNRIVITAPTTITDIPNTTITFVPNLYTPETPKHEPRASRRARKQPIHIQPKPTSYRKNIRGYTTKKYGRHNYNTY